MTQKVIAIVQSKGGLGKSTTTRNLAAALSQRYRVLAVDVDPQASLSGMFGYLEPMRGLSDVLGTSEPGTAKLKDVVQHYAPNLDVITAGPNLAASELGLATRLNRENALRKALATVSYDVVLLDSLPSVNLLMANVLTAANGVIVPTLPEIASLRTLKAFLGMIETVREELNPSLKVIGVLITMYQANLSHHQQAAELAETLGQPLFKTRIGRSVRIAEAATDGQSIFDHEANNPRALEYAALAEEVTQWLKAN